MVARMHYGVLGPLLVTRDGIAVPLARPKERAVLTMLLLNAGRAVTMDGLAEGLWDSAPPPSAQAAVRNHVMRLRQALGDQGRIRTGTSGYRIDVEPDEFDLSRFEILLATVREAAHHGMWLAVSEYAGQALALWRGEPLTDLAGDAARSREVARLEEMRLQVAELAAEAALRLGRPADVIPELKRLTMKHPLREHLHVLLVEALHGSGRDAEALAAYEDVRHLLHDELGAQPGVPLRRLLRQIISGTSATPAAQPAADPDAGSPRQLPALVRHFTGRSDELKALTELLAAPGSQAPAGQAPGGQAPGSQAPGTVAVSVITGTAGVGKTALAVRWAHEAAGSFPDGQLFVNLRGYDSGEPLPATDALAGFLRALGMPGRDIPEDENERAARYRSLLAGRRTLIILDNAREASQVGPLLPGSPTCTVLITSRDPLAGLVAREGAARLDLDLLPLGDAVQLLGALIGERARAGSDAAARLAMGCARLPLALRVAGELATARPSVPLDELAAELLSHQRRLDLLDAGGDPRTSVRSVISWSCQRLDDDTAAMLRLLGLYPGADIDAHAAAALADVTPAVARTLLSQLARAYLIQLSATDRYVMHDLLRAYASELAADGDAEESRTALARLLDYYISTVSTAIDVVFPERLRPVRAGAAPPMDPPAALAWLDAERENLVAAIGRAVSGARPGQATALAGALFIYLEAGGHYPAAVTVCEYAGRAASDAGDLAGAAASLSNLGIIAWRQSRFGPAASQLGRALALRRQTGDLAGQASVLGNLGLVAFDQGDYEEATRYLGQVRDLSRQLGNVAMEAHALAALGKMAVHRGRYEQGMNELTQALASSREAGNELEQAEVMANLGSTALRLGRYQEARDHLERALVVIHDSGYRHGEAHVLADLGVAAYRQGEPRLAASRLRRSLELFRELGEQAGEAEARNGLGEMFLASGRAGEAAAEHAAAHDIAARIGDKFQLARAHQGLAESRDAAGDRDGAERHWREALALYSALGVPEAGAVQARLAADPG
jgi:DNA-binding SARP family transcriptional activator/Tfp pilus assembly protein PilF